MKLSKLLDGISDIEVVNFKDFEITSISVNSDKCHSGTLFFAMKGASHNGIDFIPRAHKLGARAFVCGEKTAISDDSVLIYSEKPRKTLAELCAKMSGNPEKRLMFVGITGTKGKTTTAFFVSKILDGAGISNLLIGTLGIGSAAKKTVNTTPDPTVLFPALKDALHRGIKVIVLEVSSQALKDYRVYGISFDCVVFTGLGYDHIGLSEHPTLSDYVASKRSLFNSYGAKRAVVNFDDPYSSYMSAGIPRVIKCGFSCGADLCIEGYFDGASGCEFTVNSHTVRCKLFGEYNARNITLAIGTAKEICGISIENALNCVREVTVPGRFNIFKVGDVSAVVDYAHNYDSMCAALSLARRLFYGRIICVFGSVGERSIFRRVQIAKAAEKYADFSIITIDNPGYESPVSICRDIYEAFLDKSRAKIVAHRARAIDYAIKLAMPGDVVMILGRGHENSINISGVSIRFSDIEYVKELSRIYSVKPSHIDAADKPNKVFGDAAHGS